MTGVPFRRTVLLALLLAGLFAQNATLAQPSEYALKAAFVYQFLSYVTWPEGKLGAGDTIRIGVVGAPELARNLTALARSPETARMIELRSLQADGDPRNLHVLFVAANVTAPVDGLLQAAASNGVLTITERLPRPANSIVNFEIIDSKVRFDIALGRARQNGMDVSARLLQVALRVIEAP